MLRTALSFPTQLFESGVVSRIWLRGPHLTLLTHSLIHFSFKAPPLVLYPLSAFSAIFPAGTVMMWPLLVLSFLFLLQLQQLVEK